MKLYHYVHCPFCLRVRMTLGLLNISYESIVVPYDDEQTPIKLTGQKMLPIFAFNEKEVTNESLVIIESLDTKNILNFQKFQSLKNEVEKLIDDLGKPIHSLCMPYWIWTPEFNDQSRLYFQSKKEIKRGPFKNLVKNREQFIIPLNLLLNSLETNLNPFYKSETLTIIDIMIASHVWGLYILPEFQFSPKIHSYLQSVKSKCHFDYHQDFWK